jgi:hypothetical protein
MTIWVLALWIAILVNVIAAIAHLAHGNPPALTLSHLPKLALFLLAGLTLEALGQGTARRSAAAFQLWLTDRLHAEAEDHPATSSIPIR